MLLPFKERKEDREVELLHALLKLASQLQSNLDLNAVVAVVACALRDTFGFADVCVYVREGDDPVLRARAALSRDPQADQLALATPCSVANIEALLIETYRVGSAFLVPADAPEWNEELRRCLPRVGDGDGLERAGWRRGDALIVPIWDKRRRLAGMLRLGAPFSGARPSLRTISSLTVFATHASVAIANSREHEQLRKVTSELEDQLEMRRELLEVSRTVLSTLDEVSVFAKIGHMLDGLVECDAVGIGLPDENAGVLRPAYYAQAGAALDEEATTPLDEPALALVLRTSQAALVGDASDGSARVPGTQRVPHSLILAPLAVGGEVFGVLGVGRFLESAGPFGRHDFELVQLFANLAAIGLQNARSYKEMQHLASSDGLTGVHNYRHFRETLAMETSRAERYGETFCLLMMDLDHFKAVNDTVGHQQGDEVLKAVAAILRECSRESDYLARYGGEEFVMILPRTQLGEALIVAERIRGRVGEIDPGSPALKVSMSIGVAAHPEAAGEVGDGVLRAADAALLHAKATGRNRVCLHGESQEPGDDLVALGRRFAQHAGMSQEESAGFIVALTLLSAQGLAAPAFAGARKTPSDADWSQQDAVEALLYSTERWDGSGYPEGLRGREIPPAARALAVIRRFAEAGPGQPAEAARGLSRKAGSELDPHLVQRLIGLAESEWRAASGE